MALVGMRAVHCGGHVCLSGARAPSHMDESRMLGAWAAALDCITLLCAWRGGIACSAIYHTRTYGDMAAIIINGTAAGTRA